MKVLLKTVIILILSPWLTNFSLAQSSGEIIYKTILEVDDFKELEGVLVFKNDISLFFAKNYSNDLSFITKSNEGYVENNEMNFGMSFNIEPPKDSLMHQVYVDLNEDQIRSKGTIFKGGVYHSCIVIEPTGTMVWELTNESKKIDSYIAYKAKTTFRGRNYIAWFTPEIAIDAGPWKFHGLPGLILEVTDDELGVQFLFSSIEVFSDYEFEIIQPREELVLTIDEYAAYNDPDKIAQDFISWITSELPEGSSIINPSSITTNVKIKGIERVYE